MKTRCLSSGRNPMHVAAKSGNLPMVKFLLEGWSSLATTEDDLGLLPLHLAAASGHLEVAEFLSGELPNTVYAKSRTEVTPLHVAGARGSLAVLKFFCRLCPELLKEKTQDFYRQPSDIHSPTVSLHRIGTDWAHGAASCSRAGKSADGAATRQKGSALAVRLPSGAWSGQ
ncbi:unnamed protein product [Cladocopium goreaui]|uniref:Espin (Ectoplasmic specialization protein) n=1 Tax=Cladocopium goreaui TaxID=2562237 RepID=A0A9P1GRG2_9DINO|nr:unnamed protein product [Cladocopium goreaui]